jgi:putative addiction module component (TIGR02574 family)
MTVTYESIMDAALQLNPGDRSRVATCLWESIGEPVHELEGNELERFLNQREADIDADPSQGVSHEDFMAHFAERRRT